jgi:hypothetical protein
VCPDAPDPRVTKAVDPQPSDRARGHLHGLGMAATRGHLPEAYLPHDGWPDSRLKGCGGTSEAVHGSSTPERHEYRGGSCPPRSEYGLLDTGIFTGDRDGDGFVESARQTLEDTLIQNSVRNRGPESVLVHVLPTRGPRP